MSFAAEIVRAALGPIPCVFYDAIGECDATIFGLLVLPVAAFVAMILASPPPAPKVIERF